MSLFKSFKACLLKVNFENLEDDVDHGGNHKTGDRNSSGGRGDTKSGKPGKTGGQRNREDKVRSYPEYYDYVLVVVFS